MGRVPKQKRNYAAFSLEDALSLIGRDRLLRWQFYRLMPANDIFESGLYTVDDLPQLLGALDHVCSACAENVPLAVAT